MDLQNIKNVIFDLGGVIIDLDESATLQAFSRLFDRDAAQLHSEMMSTPIFQQFETGHCSPAEFRDALRAYVKVPINDHQIDQAWNAMLGPIKQERVQLLKRLKHSYRVIILSNTNAIHEVAFHQILHHVSGHAHLKHIVDHVYFSHEIKMRKPDQEIYRFVLNDQKIDARETLFLDDKLVNLEGAEAAGLSTIQVQFPDQILEIFSND